MIKKTCRFCKLTTGLKKFSFDHPIYRGKSSNWENYFCGACGCISHYKKAGAYVDYSSGEYRENEFALKDPPISPWSEISFLRRIQIQGILEKYCPYFESHLDFGGYSGFLGYAFKRAGFVGQSTISDLDKNGLKIASALGLDIVDLSSSKPRVGHYDLTTLVQVLEHTDSPGDTLESLSASTRDGGLIYIEVPNLYGFPMSDEAHLTTFNPASFKELFIEMGFEVLENGYCKTPKQSFKYGYIYSQPKECLFVLLRNRRIPTRKPAQAIAYRLNLNWLALVYSYNSIFFIASKYAADGFEKVLKAIFVFIFSLAGIAPGVNKVSILLLLQLKKIKGIIADA